MLHVIVFLVQLHLRFAQQAFRSLIIFDFNLAWGQFLAPGPVHLHHLCLPGLGSGLLLGFLLFLNFSLLSFVRCSLNLGSLFHPRDVRSSDDGSLTVCTFTNFFDVSAHFAQIIVGDNCDVLVCWHCG